MNNNSSMRSLSAIFRKFRWKMVACGFVIGVVSGSLVVAYRLAIAYGTQFARWFYGYIGVHRWMIMLTVLLLALAGAFIGWCARKVSMASGSGIPQVVGYVSRGLHMRWHTILPVRFSAGFLASLGGLSLGREGPSIQIGACGGQMVARLLRRLRKTPVKNDIKERYAVTAGAAAGLSAAFCAPLSGMMFALEEIQHSFAPTVLIGAAVASLGADFVAQYCFGLRPVLDFGNIVELPIDLHWWLLPLGIAAGLVGTLMNHALLTLQSLYARIPSKFGSYIAGGIACIVALPVGLFLPQVLGGGANLVQLAEYGAVSVGMLALLCIVKMLFTATSFGCGAPGGIFMPILAVGALAGGVCARSVVQIFHVDAKYVAILTVCVMAGTLASSVKAPLTSILLTIEMSGTLMHMLPVAVCAFLALLVSDLLGTKPIYGALLERYMRKHKRDVIAGNQTSTVPAVEEVEILVAAGSALDGARVDAIHLPQGVSLLRVQRVSGVLIPSNATIVHAGDTLIVGVESMRRVQAMEAMHAMSEATL